MRVSGDDNSIFRSVNSNMFDSGRDSNVTQNKKKQRKLVENILGERKGNDG